MIKINIIYFDIRTAWYPGFHHGLAYLIGNLKKHGYTVVLNHIKSEHELEKLANDISKKKNDLVAFSITTNQIKYLRIFINKAKLNAKLIIAGGVHCTLAKEKVLHDYPIIDGICIGEGDFPLIELCKKLDANEDYFSSPNFYFKKKDGSIIKNNLAKLHEIDSLALPDYSLFQFPEIIEASGKCFPMMISRGCPYECSYCCNKAIKSEYKGLGKYVRFPSINRAVKILKNNLSLYPKTQKIIINDDTFTANKKWLFEFLVRYSKEISLPFACNARVETIDEELIKNLKQAGCVSIDYGVESGNEAFRRKFLNRNHSNEKIIQAFALTKKYGLKCFAYVMTGIPFETKKNAKETLKFLIELQPDFGNCTYFYPYPSTALTYSCIENDILLDNISELTSYQQAPAINETHQTHKSMKKYFELNRTYFYSQLIFKSIKIPGFLYKILLSFIFLFRKPILIFLNPLSKNIFILIIRKFIRWFAYKFLRY